MQVGARPEDGDEFRLQQGKMVFFEPMFEAEGEEHNLHSELDRNSGNWDGLFEGMLSYFTGKYNQIIKFRERKTDSSSEIRDGEALYRFMVSQYLCYSCY